jgi:hypothetical protein
MVYEPDTPEGVMEFCWKEGQPHDSIKRLREERDRLAELLRVCCGTDLRLNGCACIPREACYLHGVTIPEALSSLPVREDAE